MAAHVRFSHPEHFAKYRSGPAPVAEPEPVVAESPQEAQVPQAQPQSPLEYLDAALTSLREKAGAVSADIQRLAALQAEEADLNGQIEALTQARAAFGKVVPAVPAVPAAVAETVRERVAEKPKTRAAGGA